MTETPPRPFEHIAVLMGGPSSERAVSLRSGAAVAAGLRRAGYTVAEVDVPDCSLALPSPCDAVFIALHGPFGEDGGVQALLEEAGVPYVGCGPAASRAAMDKKVSKDGFAAAGIPTPGYEVLAEGGSPSLALPVVVKPTCEGSTIGMHRVFTAAELGPALADAFRYGSEVLVESYIDGRELTVGVVDDEALPVVEIVAPDGWYDYEAKYTSGLTDYRVPAPLDAETAARVQAVALQAFRALDCCGFGRVDFRLDPAGIPYVLEINTIPGFTETSLLPKAAAEAGMDFSVLCDRILRSASVGKP